MKTTKLTEVKAALLPDTASVKNGVFMIRRSFFYTGGFTADGYAAKVKAAFPNAIILGCGEVWKAFRGGAGTAKQSHWWVKFELPENGEQVAR